MPKTGRQTISKKLLRQANKEVADLAGQFLSLIAAMERKGVDEFEAMNKPAYDDALKKIEKFINTCRTKISEL